ncbi:sulfotransferase family protein [Mycobacterium sp. NPDC003449]
MTDSSYPSTPAAGESGSRPVILFVLGMGRSGTSALTRVLSLCGAAIPPGMLGADDNNPRGYWEPRDGLFLNEKFLYRHRSSYFDPTLRLKEPGALSARETAGFVAKIRDYLQTLPAAPVVVIKVLHISVLADMWFEAARQAGFDVSAVIAVRDPEEVKASLSKFMGASPQLSGALWLKYNLLAERETRGMPRVFVEYSNFLDDWRREVKRISDVLPVDLDTSDEVGVESFLEPGLRRQRQCGPVTEPFGADWLATTFTAFRDAAHDEPFDEETVDRVFTAYQACENGFRKTFADFDGHFNLPYRLSRTFLRPVFEALAFAHGRKGTWA